MNHLVLSLMLALPPQAPTAPPPQAPLISLAEAVWLTDYAAAWEKSKETGKPLLLGCRTTPCYWCEKLEKGPLAEPATVAALRGFVCCRLDERDNTPLMRRYAEAMKTDWLMYPTLIVVMADGIAYPAVGGFQSGEELRVWLRRFAHSQSRASSLPPQAPPSVKLPTWKTQKVPCGTIVMRVSRSFADGSHEHVCPVCGTAWRHGGRSGNPVSHVCPGVREVKVRLADATAPNPGNGWDGPRPAIAAAAAACLPNRP